MSVLLHWLKVTLIMFLVALPAAYASEQPTETITLLNNRFRVDPNIEQITFLIYRSKPSNPVILVRPDGTKYYDSITYENVTWRSKNNVDLISILNPMAGPWQAIGRVTPANQITIVSNLQLETNTLPERLYHGETIKFTAQLTSEGKAVTTRDFLDELELKVQFIEYIDKADEAKKVENQLPAATIATHILGTFKDDGTLLDEVAGDGNFTVALPISVTSGKYRVQIVAGNGIFLRTHEQVVLVYPSPIKTTFSAGSEVNEPYYFNLTGDDSILMPHSLAATIEGTSANGVVDIAQGRVESISNKNLSLQLTLPNYQIAGKYSWIAKVFATDLENGRDLVFVLEKKTFEAINLIQEIRDRKIAQEEQERRRIEQEKEELRIYQEKQNLKMIIMIIIGNLVVFLSAMLAWLLINHFKKAALEKTKKLKQEDAKDKQTKSTKSQQDEDEQDTDAAQETNKQSVKEGQLQTLTDEIK